MVVAFCGHFNYRGVFEDGEKKTIFNLSMWEVD